MESVATVIIGDLAFTHLLPSSFTLELEAMKYYWGTQLVHLGALLGHFGTLIGLFLTQLLGHLAIWGAYWAILKHHWSIV